ncbi:MAG: hypothetical protein ACRDZN_12975, partial [Acidimicrobiales bacterium]
MAETRGAATASRPAPPEQIAADLVGAASDSMRQYVQDWIVSLNAALQGEYTAERLTKDATRITSRVIRDAAKLFVSGYEFVETISNLPSDGQPSG